jgi:uncharacterized protein (DUF302 family)
MRSLAFVAMSLLSIASANAQALETRESKFAVKETADRLAAEIEKRGLKVAARVDHAAGAKAAGMEMPPTEVVIFGNPKLGTPLMLSAPSIGIDLPLKMMIWQDKAGKVLIGYTSADSLRQRHGVTGRDEIFKTMAGALDGLAKAAAGQ